ncbi:MAG TPA: hypothetical protein VEL06_16060 [Haliangiales bacterium]|nr:hypothetical protein [Haliangiales bacterium]
MAASFAEASATPADGEEATVWLLTVGLFGWALAADFFAILEAALPDFFAPTLETLFRAFDLTIASVQNDEPI